MHSKGFTIYPVFFFLLEIAKAEPMKTCRPGKEQVIFNSAELGSNYRGTFTSPNWPLNYPVDTRCFYRFLAEPGKKVKITFTSFNVEGVSPQCDKDFLDIYSDVASNSPKRTNDQIIYDKIKDQVRTTTTASTTEIVPILTRSISLGRFCGHNLLSIPNTLVSLHRDLLLDLYSDIDTRVRYDQDRKVGVLGFNGTFEFISDEPYYPGQALSREQLPLDLYDKDIDPIKPFSIHEQDGRSCRFLIENPKGSGSISGTINSPTYPGLQPANLVCAYKFRAVQHTQRVKLTIVDLSMSVRDNSCISEFLEIYDGDSMNSSKILPTLCGERKSLVVMSTSKDLLVVAVFNRKTDHLMLDKNSYERAAQHRGYQLKYEFDDSSIRIPTHLAPFHVKGTECDFRILSKGQSNGTIKFPDDEFNENAFKQSGKTCTFLFLGLHSSSIMENVRININDVSLPLPSDANQYTCAAGYISINGNADNKGLLNKDKNLLDKMITHESSTEEATAEFEETKNYKFCRVNDQIEGLLKAVSASKTNPFTSARTKYMIRMSSEKMKSYPSQNIALSFSYRFQKDFGIPGKKFNHEDQCKYIYESGTGNHNDWAYSPFYPENYPNNIVCVYVLVPKANEQVRLTFNAFKMFQREACDEDYLQVAELYEDATEDELKLLVKNAYEIGDGDKKDIWRWTLTHDPRKVRQAGVFCNKKIPGPIISSARTKALVLRFHSDHVNSLSGFAVEIDYPRKSLDAFKVVSVGTNNTIVENVCRGELTSVIGTGVLLSPGFPTGYTKNLDCEWTIRIMENQENYKDKRLLLSFKELSLEGSSNSCAHAQIKIYDGTNELPSQYLCSSDSNVRAFESKSKSVRIQFQTSSKAIGSRGFQLVWTEFHDSRGDAPCQNGFICQVNKYCLPSHLECNGIPNCGTFQGKSNATLVDESDEAGHCLSMAQQSHVQIGVGVLITIIILVLFIIFLMHRESSRNAGKINGIHDQLANFPDSKSFFTDDKYPNEQTVQTAAYGDLVFPQAKDFMESSQSCMILSDSPPKHRHIYQVQDMAKGFKPKRFNDRKSYEQLEGLFSGSNRSESSNFQQYSPSIFSSHCKSPIKSSITSSGGRTLDRTNFRKNISKEKLQKVSMV